MAETLAKRLNALRRSLPARQELTAPFPKPKTQNPKPTPMATVVDSRLAIGIDVGGTNLKFAVIDEAGTIVARRTIPTDAHEGHDAVLGRMVQGASELREQIIRRGDDRSDRHRRARQLNMVTGTVLDLPNLAGHWPNVPVKEIMEAALHVPVHMLNDVKAFTIAERELGAARDARDVVCYAIGTGIGGGIMIDGKVHFGIGGAAGELGHIIRQPERRPLLMRQPGVCRVSGERTGDHRRGEPPGCPGVHDAIDRTDRRRPQPDDAGASSSKRPPKGTRSPRRCWNEPGTTSG